MTIHTYLPQDRLRAIANNTTLPDRTSGSALFADISGFTALTESLRNTYGDRRGEEELTKQLGVVYTALIGEIEKYGGSVISFAGDSMLCWFDSGVGSQGTETRAVNAAFGMQMAMKSFEAISIEDDSVTLTLKATVATGPARRFVVGNLEIMKLDALAGDTVARTATAEHLAKKGEVLLDKATVSALGDSLKVREWREEDGEKFAVIGGWESRDRGQGLPSILRMPPPNKLMSWMHYAVFEREQYGQGGFHTEFRPCTALFLRFTGIDYSSDPAESELDSFIREVQTISSRYEGTLMDITIGDKGSYAYVNFGALSAHEDDSRRAVKTALELRNKTELQLQMGITQGLMRVGAYGGETRKVFGALGDDVNLAARLMTTAKENEILLSSHVHKAVVDDFTFEPRPPLPMKGKAEPLSVFAVTGESQKRAVRLQEPNYSLPMVGRQAELKLIEEKLDLAKVGKSQVIAIVAEAGLGKSRLVAEVIRSARKLGFVGFGGACQSDGIHTPYLAWKSIWQAFFDVDPEMSERKLMRNIEGEIEDRAPSRVDTMPLLNVVLDLNIPENDFTKNLEPKIRQSALHALLEDCLKSAAGRGAVSASNEVADIKSEMISPLLIVIEDLHWIDALSHELLEKLAKALAGYAVCFVLAYRPPEMERLQAPRIEALEQFTRIELHELTIAEAESAVRAKLTQLYPARGGALPAGLVEALMARAQGNPFYLEELLNYVHDRGIDLWGLGDLTGLLDLPDSLHTLILSRIDGLSEGEKTTLRAASIIGRLFRAKWLTGYYPELGSFPQVKTALDELDKLEITPLDTPEPELAYLFKHIVTHEVTYESLPFATRARLHEQLAVYLESVNAPVETIAFHYARSENKAKQIEYLRKAGEAAQKNFANEAALEYYGALLPLLKDNDKKKLQIYLKLGEVRHLVGQLAESLGTFELTSRLAKEIDSPEEFALAALGYENTRWRYNLPIGPSLTLLEGALEILREDDIILRARILTSLVRVRTIFESQEKNYTTIEYAVATARRANDPQALFDALMLFVWRDRSPEFSDKRLSILDEMKNLAETMGDLQRVVDVKGFLAQEYLERGNIVSWKYYIDQQKELINKLQQPFFFWIRKNQEALQLINEGQFDKAEVKVQEAHEQGKVLLIDNIEGIFGLQMFTIRREQSRLKELAPILEVFIEQRSADLTWQAGLALIYCELERRNEAAAIFYDLAINDFEAIPKDSLWLTNISYLSEVCAYLGEKDIAQTLYDLFKPYDGRTIFAGFHGVNFGAVSRFLALLAITAGHWETAERHLQDALELNRKIGAWSWLAHTQYLYAIFLLTRPQRMKFKNDREKAKSILLDVMTTTKDLGMVTLDNKTNALIEKLKGG